MPPKFSHTVLPAYSFGSVNSFRYHHDGAYGLSRRHREVGKIAADRVFHAGKLAQVHSEVGVGNSPAFTWAATTVVGISAAIQPGAA